MLEFVWEDLDKAIDKAKDRIINRHKNDITLFCPNCKYFIHKRGKVSMKYKDQLIEYQKKEIKELKEELDQIDQKEQNNLINLAATYDKMDVTGASKIMASLCKPEGPDLPKGSDAGGKSGSYDDAVKILHYMTERTKAKLLAELATSEPILAAGLCQRLKQIVESR